MANAALRSQARLLTVLAVLFGLVVAVSAWKPISRADWILENVLAAGLIVILVTTRRRFPLSRASYLSLFVFLVLHEIGAHYTYSKVPWDAWLQAAIGWSPHAAFDFSRNHYDRFVHFAYGLLFALPIREVYLRIADVRGFWGYFLPLDLAMSTSMLYELLEWAAAMVFGGELGHAYLGTQGDAWDAHKDMAMAALGALTAVSIMVAIHASTHRDFAREFSRSLEVKNDAEPI